MPYPVVVDVQLEIWEEYGKLGWPARYLFDGRSRLFEYHYGEGGYDETERAIKELLGIDEPVLEPIRPRRIRRPAGRADRRRRGPVFGAI